MNILRPPKAAQKCGIATPTIWAWVGSKPDFPRPVRISENVTGFIEEEIDAYLARKVSESRAAPSKRKTALEAAKKSSESRRNRKMKGCDHAHPKK